VARSTAEHGFDDSSGSRGKNSAGVVGATVSQDADDLMAGNEREADQVLEVTRGATVDGGEVRTTDAR
jgi:hypothetical protein